MPLTYPLVASLWHHKDEFDYQSMEILTFITEKKLREWLTESHSHSKKWSTDIPSDKKIAKKVALSLKELTSEKVTDIEGGYECLTILDVPPGKRILQVFHDCPGSMVGVQHEEFDSVKEAMKYIRKSIPKEARTPERKKYIKEDASYFVLLYWTGQGEAIKLLEGVEFEILKSV